MDLFPVITCFRLLFLQIAINGSIKKVFSRVLFVCKMDQWFWIISVILGSVQWYVTVGGNTWVFCVVFGARTSFLSRSKLLLHYFTIAVEFAVCWTDSFDTQYLTVRILFLSDAEWSDFAWRWYFLDEVFCFLLKESYL